MFNLYTQNYFNSKTTKYPYTQKNINQVSHRKSVKHKSTSTKIIQKTNPYHQSQQYLNQSHILTSIIYYFRKIKLFITNMYTAFKPNNSVNKSIVTVDPTQTQLQTLQREVDNYTRKLEQEKRKFFSIQDSLKNITEDYQKQKSRLNQLKKQNSKAHNVMLQAKVKNLQANLDKAISTYNDTVAHNNKLKSDIDMLRREKKNYIEMLQSLEDQIKRYQIETQQKFSLIQKKKRRAQQLKQEIIQIKAKNEIERDQYIKQFDSLQKEYMNDKRDRQTLKFQKNHKPQSIDTQPLLKYRLKKILNSNKEKLKMIEQYKKHMKSIEEAFNDIKQKSGINTLQEITNTFIKSEQQNYSLYNYMDELSRNIDTLTEQNKQLENKIQESKLLNQQKKELLKNMSQQQKSKAEVEAYLTKKQQCVRQLNDLIEKVKPILGQTLLQLSKTKYNDDPKKKQDYQMNMNITDRNIQQYLSDLEKYINILVAIRHQNKIKGINNIKQTSTNYSKPLPVLSYDDVNKQKIDGKEQNRFIQQNKFRQYALQYWQKRKNKGKQ